VSHDPQPTDDRTRATAKLAHHVMALMTADEDERHDQVFNYLHVLGFADAFEEAKAADIDARGFVDWMLHESEGARVVEDARAIIAKAGQAAEEKKGGPSRGRPLEHEG
jgi:hypothetical protein